ncbi:trypsin-like cysteine/serine peptidase domain-containing protein [Chaetomium fimeti]|uniref:Trypsin-like cysteine/serine peptidase domain-containing protein n=1 Tax=Chaetomium fimeti TaxID=1854472 RepID=A0AAE0LPL5_9PEZI|nr:trypsin-like cysteine/serine peptidase domain-containing protein [Chaetomium fimeti]
MELPLRQTRLRTRQLLLIEAQTLIQSATKDASQEEIGNGSPAASPDITLLPSRLLRSHTKLSKEEHALLLLKQARLQAAILAPPTDVSISGIAATLIFAQAEAGTAVCIHESGLLLTCAHCIADTEVELDVSKSHLLLFASGTVVLAQCAVWDPKRDLALLKITAAQRPLQDDSSLASQHWQFPALGLADRSPKVGTKLVCIGQPGSEDLECEEAGVETGYEVLCASEGRFEGYADGQDVQDNEEIGALMHSCWTYWGHSGAPLVQRTAQGEVLVGVHSSWDEETAMRRGVGIEAIREFLRGKIGLETGVSPG